MLNYFKTKSRIFFFSEVPSLEYRNAYEAYVAAEATGESISICRVTKKPGVWDRVPVVGHRARGAIVRDLDRVRSPEAKEKLHQELDALTACFTSVGRRAQHLSAVAA